MANIKQHTPGPWIMSKYGNVEDKNGNIIRTKGFALSSGAEAEANAKLMAMAPEMFELLKKVRLSLSDNWIEAKQIDELLER